MWFAIPFFLSQALCILLRALFAKRGFTHIDVAVGAICLALGCIPIVVGSDSGISPGQTLLMCRVFYMMPWFSLGWLAKCSRDRVERFSTIRMLMVIIALKAIVCYLCSGNGAYSQWICRFPDGILLTLGSTVLGIAFWWKICLTASRYLGDKGKQFVDVIGGNTFSIMSHHVMGFFALNCVFAAGKVLFSLFEPFSVAAFKTDVYYQYFPHETLQLGVLYVICGTAFSIAVHHLWECLRKNAGRFAHEDALIIVNALTGPGAARACSRTNRNNISDYLNVCY